MRQYSHRRNFLRDLFLVPVLDVSCQYLLWILCRVRHPHQLQILHRLLLMTWCTHTGPSNDAIKIEGDKAIGHQHLAANTDTVVPAPPDSSPHHLEADNVASISASQGSSALEFTTSTNRPIEQPQLHTRLQAGVHKSKLYTLMAMFIMVALLN
jgi:hypothetical protein